MRFSVPVYRRAAQALQYADLNFVRLQRMQAVESAPETFEIFPRQPGDQVNVNQRVRLLAQPADIRFGLRVVLSARDACLNVRIPGLNADFEMQCARRKAR